jgi:hypothetical protein
MYGFLKAIYVAYRDIFLGFLLILLLIGSLWLVDVWIEKIYPWLRTKNQIIVFPVYVIAGVVFIIFAYYWLMYILDFLAWAWKWYE